MPRLKVAVLAIALVSVAVTSSVSASAQRRVRAFTFINSTRSTIMEVYVSPTLDGNWGEDVLGRDIVRPGQRIELAFSRPEPTCRWDLKIVNEDNVKFEWQKFNLCEITEITLKNQNGKPTALVK